MNCILNDIIKDINDKIKKLNQEKLELTIVLNSDSIVENKVGDCVEDLKCKFNELLNYIDLKLEVCKFKRKKYEDDLCKEYYNTWLTYVEQKKQYINNLTETLGSTDLFSVTDLSETNESNEISETNDINDINEINEITSRDF
jgi:hypothetical protein